jgi:hypothetical protein
MKRSCLSLLVVGLLMAPAFGQMVIVDEDFDSYPSWDEDSSQTAFHAAWRPDNGDGVPSLFSDPTEAGFLVPNNGGFLNVPNDNPPGIEGKGVALNTATHESTAAFSLMPSDTQWIKFGGDIFNDGPGVNDVAAPMRQTIGLRNDTFDRDPATPACECGVNFIEMGFYNTSAAVDTRTGAAISDRNFHYRLSLLSPGANPLPSPDNQNWLSHVFDPALDVTGPPAGDGDYDNDDEVSAADYVLWRKSAGTDTALANDPTGGTIGQAQYDTWQQNFGEGGPNGVVDLVDIGEGWHTFTALIKPASITLEVDLYRDGINNATGQTGVDVSTTWAVQMNTAAAAAGAFTSLRFGGPSGVAPGEQAVFDNIFLMTITPPAQSAGGLSLSGVPEPASLALAALMLACVSGDCRRRRG